MAANRTITQQIRFLLTAVTWCCVLLLNNQVITTYQPVIKGTSAAGDSQLQKNTSRKEQTVVKQKVTFEATTSYFILQIAHFTNWLKPIFQTPTFNIPEPLFKVYRARYFFRVLFSFIIIPNAP
ncbi:hypothetical protein AHMF7605_01070 [Adhaeribacter arboris]|uniref:Uncharacterized protein n=1 Tax=Adhaeribacter arboris TaxID=2072846 RepID=A0A2T2Y9L8_9BACT|nr:hypothetical protein [Adhaeribacter arboris]PSR52209.1 hypothetical protein AHMF7605_01070 [Adhaeribacter arboris]